MFQSGNPFLSSTLLRDKSKDIHRRMILKSGACNVRQAVSKRDKLLILRYSKLVDSSWTFTFSVFLAILFISWTCFAAFYWLICFVHGDFEPNHLPAMQEKNNFKPCIYDMVGFSSAFLFSMEAQHTLGYGIKAPTQECAEAIFVNAIHCIIGFIMQGFMAAIIFSKMTKPRLRSQTLIFSKNAVISRKNSKLCLMFRVADIRQKHLVDTKIRVFLIKSSLTQEKEFLPFEQIELKSYMDGCSKAVFFNWPIVMYHILDEDSPLYSLSPGDLCQRKFEIMVVIEGTDETTGQVTQARSSYMPNEILWGYKFENLIQFDSLRGEYEVDFAKFDNVICVNTPLCSAAYNDQLSGFQNATIRTKYLQIDIKPRQSSEATP
ncbi:inward rectifier potassium channel 2-like isoform X2 [Anthonomus grandis grandis]|uniref:inward rectifier potassium channel 2-like isoform X2 n=1 Tax=Anthonomus grandis grandis TaxID=2921223 RepID=UPI00216653E9|nr:inward rectifier potassium channel 2-like isoform X2 [Anthonomus grandis grandis]